MSSDSDNDDLELVEVSSPAALELIGRLRVHAWRTEIQIPVHTTVWLESADFGARHWAFMRHGTPVAAARLTIHDSLADVPDAEVYSGVFQCPPPPPIASLNRLVVAPEFRGRHLAAPLDRVRLDAAILAGCHSAIGATSASERRISPLESLGFSVIGLGQPYAAGFLKAAKRPIVLQMLLNSNVASNYSTGT